jgi:iron complex outermembrane receptor protein
VEPLQRSREHTASLALENTYHAAAEGDLVLGLSYDKNDLRLAQEFNDTAGLFEYPTGGSNAANAQGAIHWRYAESAKLHASISSRTRFPTLFERFSTRFGNALPNPSLDPERSTNYELGWEGNPRPDTNLSATVFYNDVQDLIQTVVVTVAPTQITQTQNVGNGEFYGLELAADSRLGDKWRIGANYSWLKRKIVDPLQPDFKPVGTPTHQAFVFVSYRPIDALMIISSLEFADDRWSDVTGGTYRRTGEYTMVDLQAQYSGSQFGNGSSWQAAIGASNLLDENFELAHGFPEPGRSFYAKLKLTF